MALSMAKRYFQKCVFGDCAQFAWEWSEMPYRGMSIDAAKVIHLDDPQPGDKPTCQFCKRVQEGISTNDVVVVTEGETEPFEYTLPDGNKVSSALISSMADAMKMTKDEVLGIPIAATAADLEKAVEKLLNTGTSSSTLVSPLVAKSTLTNEDLQRGIAALTRNEPGMPYNSGILKKLGYGIKSDEFEKRFLGKFPTA